MNSEIDVRQWINEAYLPSLLRAITKLCQERYKADMRKLAAKDVGSGRDWLQEDTPEDRRIHDVAMAYLGIDLNYLAINFEERLASAGLSAAERDARDRANQIERLEKELASLRLRAREPVRSPDTKG